MRALSSMVTWLGVDGSDVAMLVAVAVEGKRRNILKKEIIYSKFRAGPLNLKEKKMYVII